MKGLAKYGMTMIVVTHLIGFAREVGDTLSFMDRGVVVERAYPREIIANPQYARMQESSPKSSEQEAPRRPVPRSAVAVSFSCRFYLRISYFHPGCFLLENEFLQCVCPGDGERCPVGTVLPLK